MRLVHLPRLAALVTAASLALVLAAPVSAATTWYSGQRMFAGFSVEPAVNVADGSEVFLLTPNKAPTNANAVHAHAPLWLVLYPNVSTVDASVLDCVPTNCDHANDFPPYDNQAAGGLKGHDHLVGIPPTGDFNIAWDVYPVFFTQQGFEDHAIDTRILTKTQLDGAIAKGDAFMVPVPVLSFNCAKTAVATYLKGTPFVTG